MYESGTAEFAERMFGFRPADDAFEETARRDGYELGASELELTAEGEASWDRV